jgi:ABC-type lipoprotein release transport system permease subunit
MKTLKRIIFWWKIAFLFLSRSIRSTAILSLMLMTAVAALIFLSALAVGVNDAMIRNSVSLYSGHITGFYIPDNVRKETLKAPGVIAVLKRKNVPGSLIFGHKIHEVTMTEMESREELAYTAISRKVTAGEYPSETRGQVLMGWSIARKLGAQLQDTIYFADFTGKYKIPLRITGLYRTGIDHLDGQFAFCPSGSLPSPGPNWTAAIFLEEGASPDKIISTYDGRFHNQFQFKSWATLMPDLKQLIDLNYVSMSIVILLVFFVVSLGIACAFVIVILKTIREYGILKAMGVTSRENALLIVCEIIMMNLFATILGILLGIGLSLLIRETGIDLTAFTSHNRYFVVSGIIYPRLTPFAWGVPPAMAFLFSLIAAVWPAVLVSHRRAAEILRLV